jgi:pimeloyl-ACP methyl ester carboxylesterase
MSSKMVNSELAIINNCGHNAHLEKPNEFVILMNNFLKNLGSNK